MGLSFFFGVTLKVEYILYMNNQYNYCYSENRVSAQLLKSTLRQRGGRVLVPGFGFGTKVSYALLDNSSPSDSV